MQHHFIAARSAFDGDYTGKPSGCAVDIQGYRIMFGSKCLSESSYRIHSFSILRPMKRYRVRRLIAVLMVLLAMATAFSSGSLENPFAFSEPTTAPGKEANRLLETLAVKGRAPKTGYGREQFGDGWSQDITGCDTRNRILQRDLRDVRLDEFCTVLSGRLADPYTGRSIMFERGETTSDDVQIDHVVALSNAWQTGAQQLPYVRRVAFANDPLNLIAVEGLANQSKSDGDAATWLPPNKDFRCQYVSRQVAVKGKYELWVTLAEKEAIKRVLSKC